MNHQLQYQHEPLSGSQHGGRVFRGYKFFNMYLYLSDLLPPTLAVNPPVVSGKESVTLICQAPSDVSVSECHFYSEARKSTKRISCLETLTGSELLMSQQTLPAKLEFKCFYTVKFEDLNLPSPYSDASSIIVQSE